MTLAALDWSAPATGPYATIRAADGQHKWTITPVPRDVVRIGYEGVDADGTIVECRHDFAHAESVDEAKIVIDLMRAGTDGLPEWRDQIEAAGLVRWYPEAADDDILSCIWREDHATGTLSILVLDGFERGGHPETSVSATFEPNGSEWHHNVSSVAHVEGETRQYGPLRMRMGTPEGVDALRTGMAAALAIRAARIARGGDFALPIGEAA